MPRFNVGDRVRFINENSNGGARYGRVGEIGVIFRDYGNESYSFHFEDPNRDLGFPPGVGGQDIELAGAAPQPEEAQTATFYTLFYRNDMGVLRSWGVDTQAAAEDFKLRNRNYTFLAMKKIKINLGQ